jgi:probable HAF family extracellular repeat protein
MKTNLVALALIGALSSVSAQPVAVPENTPLPKRVQFSVTCLDCSLDVSLTPTGINSSGVIVANSTRGHRTKAHILDHGKISVVPGADAAYAINDSGLVVGLASGVWEGNVGFYAYTWDGSTLTLLGDPVNVYPQGGYFSKGLAVNALGQVAGQAIAAFLDAFIYSEGVMTAIEVPDSQSSYATGINSQGRVVGTAPPGEQWYAWTYKDGVLTNLNNGYGRSDAFGINEHDQIVGDVHVYQDNGQVVAYAVIWDRSAIPTFLPAPAGKYFETGFGINNRGWVVGQICPTPAYLNCVAAVSDGKRTVDMNELLDSDAANWVLTTPVGINDSGQIIGTGTFSGQPHAFLATPKD